DEIEKAHPDVFNVLLQLLDDGRLTDGQGRVVDFRNTVAIMTSNIGSQFMLDGVDGEIASERVMGALRDHFRPEFLNRVDEIVQFQKLDRSDIDRVVDLQMAGLETRLQEQDIRLVLMPEAREMIAEIIYTSMLRDTIRKMVAEISWPTASSGFHRRAHSSPGTWYSPVCMHGSVPPTRTPETHGVAVFTTSTRYGRHGPQADGEYLRHVRRSTRDDRVPHPVRRSAQLVERKTGTRAQDAREVSVESRRAPRLLGQVRDAIAPRRVAHRSRSKRTPLARVPRARLRSSGGRH
ncbi:MAG TPA: hypothetical protein EYQ27_21385, partial [Gemmatimonadetes bacterium]|nr:hypothetical protein [Gemmatimonadota bacterium]